jgi:hypothetical protein
MCIYIGKVFPIKRLTTAVCDSHYCTCLGFFGQHNTNKIISMCAALPNVAKASTVLSVACCCCQSFNGKNFANVRDSLLPHYPGSRGSYNLCTPVAGVFATKLL